MYKDKLLKGPYRVYPGKLSVSRTVGDAEGKIEAIGGNPNVIVPLPNIFCFDLEKDVLIFAFWGVMEFMINYIVKMYLNMLVLFWTKIWMHLKELFQIIKKKYF